MFSLSGKEITFRAEVTNNEKGTSTSTKSKARRQRRKLAKQRQQQTNNNKESVSETTPEQKNEEAWKERKPAATAQSPVNPPNKKSAVLIPSALFSKNNDVPPGYQMADYNHSKVPCPLGLSCPRLLEGPDMCTFVHAPDEIAFYHPQPPRNISRRV